MQKLRDFVETWQKIGVGGVQLKAKDMLKTRRRRMQLLCSFVCNSVYFSI